MIEIIFFIKQILCKPTIEIVGYGKWNK